LGGRGKQIYEFKASLVYNVSEFQDSQGYTEKPCLNKRQTNKQTNKQKHKQKQKQNKVRL
jgi:hypothetical protein